LSHICFEEGLTYKYKVKDLLPNRKYSWFVEGGILLSDPTAEEIEVQWGPAGTSGEIWYEEFSEVNPSCGGDSKRLQVNVYTPLQAKVDDITEFICEGSNEGSIRIDVSGGTGEYNFNWPHDPELNANEATGLGVGFYEVEVIDVGGCVVWLEQLEIKEADPMELEGEPAIVDAACYDSADGYVSFNIQGGVPPYRVDDVNALVMGGSIQLLDLERGDYTFQVFDATKCVFEVEVSIGSPEPIVAPFELEKVACPGVPSGILTVIPDGGIAPYAFTWDWDGSTGPSLVDIPSGAYVVNVMDSNGCSQEFTGEMREGIPQLRMPTGYDPRDGLFMGVSNCDIDFKLMVYNKWGQLLHAGGSGWDGLINGEEALAGTYSYMIEYIFSLEGVTKTRQQRGVFTLFR
jgi:hypothetical protein